VAAGKSIMEKKIKELMRQSFYPNKIKQVFSANGNFEIYFDGNIIPMNFYYEFNIGPDFLSALTHERQKELYNSLLTCACTNRKKEIDIVVRLLRNNLNIKQRKIFSKKVLWLLKKFAFKKYKVDFILCVSRIKELIKKEPINFKLIENGLYSIEDIAYSRFIG